MDDFQSLFVHRLSALGLSKARLIVQDAEQKTLVNASYQNESTEKDSTLSFQASCLTKPLTALATLLLIPQGKLDLGLSVLEALNTSIAPADARFKAIKIKDLLSNSAGLARGGYASSYSTAQSLLHQVLQTPLALTPGEAYKYSNLSFYLLAELIEAVQELSFEAYVKKSILNPLGLSDTYFISKKNIDSPETGFWQGQYFGSANLDRTTSKAPYLPLLKGAGGLVSTEADYLKILHLLAGNLTGINEALDSAAQQLQNIRFQLSNYRFALPGLYRLNRASGSILYKMGSSSGYSSVAVIEPATQRVALAIANQVAMTRTLRHLTIEALDGLNSELTIPAKSLKPQRISLVNGQGKNLEVAVPESPNQQVEVSIDDISYQVLEYKPKAYYIKAPDINSLLRLKAKKKNIQRATLGQNQFEGFPDLEDISTSQLAGWYESKELGMVEIYSRQDALIMDWGLANESHLIPVDDQHYQMNGGPFNLENIIIEKAKSIPAGFRIGPIQFIRCPEPGTTQSKTHEPTNKP